MKVFIKFFSSIIFILFLIFIHVGSIFAVDITNSWSSTTSIRSGASLVSFSSPSKAYVIGGSASTGNSYKEIISAVSGNNGQFAQWTSEGNFPTALIFHAIARRENDIFVLGGREENPGSANDFVNRVFLGKLDNLGNLGAWSPQASLPNNLGMGAAVIINNRIYFAGGFNNSVISQKVYSALINPDGSLGAWIVAGDMPDPRFGFSMIEFNNNLIILGGYNGSYLNTVYKTTPNPDGTISFWQSTTSFPTPLYRSSFIKIGTNLLAVGGFDGNSTTDKIYYTTLHNDGTVDGWQLSSNHLPSPVHGGAVAQVGNYLYLTGGFNANNGSYLNTVYFTKLNLETTLNVPLLKQTDPLWGSQIYDSANIWSSSYPGINSWGCALTSAAMVFQYHKITKLTDGTPLDPGSLNAWLKGQIDGYVNTGWINWLALTRLSKQSKSKNPNFSFDALEYRRIGGVNLTQLKTDLENNIPGILEEPGHFIVGKGTLGSSFSINDPYFIRTSLSDYSNTFLSLGRFIPSHTDLSYLMFVVDDGITLTVKNSNGNVIGGGFTQAPLDQDGGIGKNGPPAYFYYVPIPASGSYTVQLSSNGQKKYALQTFTYDVDGNIKINKNSGVNGGGTSDSYLLTYDKQNNNSSSISEKVSYDNLISDLDYFYNNKLITNLGVYLSLKAKAQQARDLAPTNKNIARSIMSSFITQLDTNRKKVVLEEAYQILKPQADALLKTLQ